MARIKTEKEMRPIVEQWLKAHGYLVLHETLMGAGYCDLYGVIFYERRTRAIPNVYNAIAIELKINNVADVIRQATKNRYFSELSYAAMPDWRCEKMTVKSRNNFRRNQIGLLSVNEFEVKEIIDPIPWNWLDERMDIKFLRKIWRRTKDQRIK